MCEHQPVAERLSGLDSSFLHLEAGGHADARRLHDPVRGAGAAIPRVPRSHLLAAPPGSPLSPKAPLRPLRPGAPGVGGRPSPEPRLPRPPHVLAAARQRTAAAAPRRADLLSAPRPLEAPLGAVAGRGAERRAVRDRRKDPPLPRRRDLRGRHHHRPLRPRARAGPIAGEGVRGMATRAGTGRRSSARRRLGGARGQPGRDRSRGAPVPARPRRASTRSRMRVAAAGSFAWAGIGAPASPFNVDIGPHRRFTWVRASLRRPEASQGSARRDGQRRRPRGRLRRPRSLPALPRSPHCRRRAAGNGPGERPLRRSAGSPRQPGDDDDGPAARSGARTPCAACTS